MPKTWRSVSSDAGAREHFRLFTRVRSKQLHRAASRRSQPATRACMPNADSPRLARRTGGPRWIDRFRQTRHWRCSSRWGEASLPGSATIYQIRPLCELRATIWRFRWPCKRVFLLDNPREQMRRSHVPQDCCAFPKAPDDQNTMTITSRDSCVAGNCASTSTALNRRTFYACSQHPYGS